MPKHTRCRRSLDCRSRPGRAASPSPKSPKRKCSRTRASMTSSSRTRSSRPFSSSGSSGSPAERASGAPSTVATERRGCRARRKRPASSCRSCSRSTWVSSGRECARAWTHSISRSAWRTFRVCGSSVSTASEGFADSRTELRVARLGDARKAKPSSLPRRTSARSVFRSSRSALAPRPRPCPPEASVASPRSGPVSTCSGARTSSRRAR